MPGDCHYLEGNFNAKRRIERIQHHLKEIGLEPERIEMFNLSAAMASNFVEATVEMTEKIKTLGPNPLNPREQREEGA
jgi:coenzyme F420-reducing hydrogenase delta subunit